MSGHALNGNCFKEAYGCSVDGCRPGELCDACHEHCEPRGDCDECGPCLACEDEG